MRLMRAIVFAVIAIFPGLLLALFAYLLLGGPPVINERKTWMYGPCYGVPGLCVLGAFILGLREDRED